MTSPSNNSHSPGPARVPLPGSERAPAPNAAAAAPGAAATGTVEISVYLRRAGDVPDDALPGKSAGPDAAAAYGASAADIDLVTTTLTGLGATVTEADAATRRLRVSGPAGVLAGIFGTTLETVTSTAPDNATVTHRHRTGGLSVPAALDGVITAVLGLDDRPQSRAQFHVSPAKAANVSYSPPQLGTIYGFPQGTDGTGQTVSIIELGGGFDQADLDTYFAGLGITGPTVTAVGVDGAVNVPGGDPQGADGEVLLDVEVVGALANGASVKVYFAPNTDAGFVDAIAQAAHDTPTPAAISISWGQSEDQWTAQARTAMDNAMIDAAVLGITVTAAAGDNGSADGETDGNNHVDFPASSPHALACGGTRLEANPTTGAVQSETVWNDSTSSATGGGVSDTFPLPSWQANITAKAKKGGATAAKGRGVPDVAGVADPETGYNVRVDGTDMVIGGTSAVAPLWAALIARMAQSAGHGFGLIQPALYANLAAGSTTPGFRDITKGSNGAFHATAGWDACTGLGVPVGTALLAALTAG
ncbi:peptidase S53 [Arthrobacter sp. ERGS1:01]|uniref:S53 family peptidase n=1 Tax=Arthrobacter sp. ERGS1:01 TaxID=1704044 RepID=UPI0006B55D46|nr:S53 family peptidase [Arthrobacter sp. ERGS1:01]ALE07748.1 peptidase S53 [Arthrobacter sp. ERGS1:01]